MIILYGFGEGFGLPEISPFVTKTEVHLKMAGLSYRKELARPDSSPKGQMPYIDDGGETIADSTFIRAHLERRYGVDFDAALNTGERAQAWAVERMVEHHLYWALVGVRWVDATNFAKGPAHFFDGAPDHVRDEARARAGENFRISGLGRHVTDEWIELAVRSLSALSVLLSDKSHLFGKRPCGVDAAAFAVLAGLLTPYFDSPLRQRARQFDNLAGYVDRMMSRYYPDYAMPSSETEAA